MVRKKRTGGPSGGSETHQPLKRSAPPPQQTASISSMRLPLRPRKGSYGERCVVKANHFFAELPNKDLYQYDVTITPEVTSRGVNRAVMDQLVKLYRESLLGRRLPAYDGRKSLYTAGALPFATKEFRITLVDEDDGAVGQQRRDREFKVVIKLAARADLHHLGLFLEGRQTDAPREALQFLDIVLRELPTTRYCPVGRSFYSPDLGRRQPLGDGLESWHGFYQNIRPTQMGLSLNIATSSTAFIEPLPVKDFVAQLLNRDIATSTTRPLSDADRVKTIVPSTLQLSAMIMKMLAISPVLCLISAMVIPCMVLVVALLGQELKKISKQSYISIAALSAYLNEMLPAILFVKANNAELSESVRFKKLALMDYSAKLNKKRMKAVIPQVIQAICFGALSMICAGSVVISRGSFDRCSLVSFVTSLLFLIEPIQDVGKAYNEWMQGEPAVERMFAMTKFKNKVVEKPDAVHLDHVTGDLKFCDVSFKYNDDTPLVLNGLNLHIRTGEIVAIVGPSGGGKTTLVKLLLRLYEPISGSILIDNQNIQNIRLQSLRRHVGVVSQDITLLSGTVAENIGYRDLTTKIDMERVKRVAKTAHADEFIRKLPEGYKTNIGPRGSALSGGQRQRLAIARALYQNSSILVLDEATSALDSKSELLVRQAVERLMENRTVLVISHRVETVMMANRIFLLDNGKLEELPRSTMLNGHMNSLLSSGRLV